MPVPVIVAAARTPIGRAFKGSLTGIRADDLAAVVVSQVLSSVPELDPAEVEDLYLGAWDHTGEQSENLARRVAVISGHDSIPAVTVNRACASSLQTTRMAANAIRSGDGHVFLSVGSEVVSRYPGTGDRSGLAAAPNPCFDAARARTAQRSASGTAWSDPRATGELPDIYIGMGETAENVASLRDISREDQDAFALRSQQRAARAIESGFFAREITPVTTPDGTIVTTDDGPRPDATLEALAELRPVFREDGTVTAGNCCSLNDGAAAIVVMSDVRAQELGLTPLARILSFGATGLSPEIMGLGPVEAIRSALGKAGLSTGDVDLFEINEAFASQVIASVRELSLDEDRLNVHGGAIALGHPFGMTGARITTTLLNGLQATDGTIGVESMCVGGGQGMAMVVERLS